MFNFHHFSSLRAVWFTFHALAAIGLLTLALPTTTYGALVNLDTGEGYIPQVDEDGELEEPPEWVYENQQSQGIDNGYVAYGDIQSFTGETSVDACLKDTQSWLESSAPAGELLHESIDDDAIYRDFVALLDTLLYIVGAEISWAYSLVDIHAIEVTTFNCQTPYVLLDCLDDGFDMFWCKRYINAPTDFHSSIGVDITLTTLGSTGTVSVDGTLDYREVFESGSLDRRLACINITRLESTFGSLIENLIDDVLTDEGDWCQVF